MITLYGLDAMEKKRVVDKALATMKSTEATRLRNLALRAVVNRTPPIAENVQALRVAVRQGVGQDIATQIIYAIALKILELEAEEEKLAREKERDWIVSAALDNLLS